MDACCHIFACGCSEAAQAAAAKLLAEHGSVVHSRREHGQQVQFVPLNVNFLHEHCVEATQQLFEQKCSELYVDDLIDDDDYDWYHDRLDKVKLAAEQLVVNWLHILHFRLAQLKQQYGRGQIGLDSQLLMHGREKISGVPSHLVPLLLTIGPKYDSESQTLFVPAWPEDVDVNSFELQEHDVYATAGLNEPFSVHDPHIDIFTSKSTPISAWWAIDIAKQHLLLSPSCYVAMDFILLCYATSGQYFSPSSTYTFTDAVAKGLSFPYDFYMQINHSNNNLPQPTTAIVAGRVTLGRLCDLFNTCCGKAGADSQPAKQTAQSEAPPGNRSCPNCSYPHYLDRLDTPAFKAAALVSKLLQLEAKYQITALKPLQSNSQQLAIPLNITAVCALATDALTLKPGTRSNELWLLSQEAQDAAQAALRYCLQSRVASIQNAVGQHSNTAATAVASSENVCHDVSQHLNYHATCPHAYLPEPLAHLVNSVCSYTTSYAGTAYHVVPCLPRDAILAAEPTVRQWQLVRRFGQAHGARQVPVSFSCNLEAHCLKKEAEVSKWWTIGIEMWRQPDQVGHLVQQLPGDFPPTDILLAMLLIDAHGPRGYYHHEQPYEYSFSDLSGCKQLVRGPRDRVLIDWRLLAQRSAGVPGPTAWELLCQ